MRKLLLFFFALLTGVSGAWATAAYTTVSLGSQVTDLASLSSSKYYVLKNVGTSKYNYYNKNQMDATSDLSVGSVVKLSYDGASVTIQEVSTGKYYQGLVNDTRVSLGASPVSYTFNTDGVESGQFRFANNDLYMNRDDSGSPKGASTSFKGDYSRWNIYEVTINDLSAKTFTLQCARGYVYWDGSTMVGDASNKSKFAVVPYEGNTYLFDATNSKFVCHTTAATAGTSGNAVLESDNDFSKIAKNIFFGATAISGYPFYVEESEFTNWLNMDGTPKVYLNRWTNFENGNGGNTYKVEFVDNDFVNTAAIAMLDGYFHPSSTVTYVISDASGIIYTSEAVPATIGQTITSLPSEYQRPYCTYSVTSTTIVAGNNEVPVTLTAYNPPFTVSSDFASATWYYATLRGKQLRADESAKDGSGRYQTNTTNERTDVYKWAFVGNPYNLSIMNKGAGDSKVLYAGDVPVMQAATPASDNKARWIVSANGDGFSVRSESGANLYINDASNGGNLGYWNSSWGATDAGSCWVVTEVPVGEDEFNAIIAELEVINWGLTASGNNGKPNYYNFIGDYAEYAGKEMGYIESLKTAGYSAENLATAQDILANGYALNIPATGKFYRIKGYSNNYITSNTAGSNASMNGTASANNIIYYNASNNFVFFGSGYGMYNTSIVAPAGSTLNTYTFSEGAQSSHYYIRSNATGIGTYCYDNTSNGTKVDRNTNPVTSGSYQTDWTVEEITTLPVAISAAGYATLYSPVALSIPSGITVYKATDNGDYLTLTAVASEADDVIPANQGFIIAGAEGSHNFTVATGGSVDGNALNGTTVAITRPSGSYILADGTAGVGFYADGPGTIPGFKAYLAAGGGGVKSFVFDDETAVKAIEAAMNPNKVVYDLNGRRVENPAKGLYIVNGKKVIIK